LEKSTKQAMSPILGPGAAPRGVDCGRTVPPLHTKVIFVSRLKPMRKYWEYGRCDVTYDTWISAWVCHKWCSKI